LTEKRRKLKNCYEILSRLEGFTFWAFFQTAFKQNDNYSYEKVIKFTIKIFLFMWEVFFSILYNGKVIKPEKMMCKVRGGASAK